MTQFDMLSILKKTVKKLPGLSKIIAERNTLQHEVLALRAEIAVQKEKAGFVPPGHYYSPIPDLAEISSKEADIFTPPAKAIPGIEMNEDEQLRLLHKFVRLYNEIPFEATPKESLRYYFENPSYSYSDAICLYCMIRHAMPKTIVEVGSGFSSCVTLDTRDRYLDETVQTIFIEPYPQLLQSLLRPGDDKTIKLIPSQLQDVSLGVFDQLKANDILFVDSTHVSKINSDVNYLIFEILPRLSSGVYIHFHDVFFPFEYPQPWIYEGRAWNEAYLLRGFLQYNNAFDIVLMNTFMEYFHSSFFSEHMPLCLKNLGGSIWLRKR